MLYHQGKWSVLYVASLVNFLAYRVYSFLWTFQFFLSPFAMAALPVLPQCGQTIFLSIQEATLQCISAISWAPCQSENPVP